MQKEVRINSLFGETIYHAEIENYEKINKDIVSHVQSFVKASPGSTAATTDVKGNTMFTDLETAKDNLHTDNKYKDLFKQLEVHITNFLKAKGYDESKFDAHITKAWATYTVKNQHIASHKHTASHFSMVYYARNDQMGDIQFEKELASQTGLFIPPTKEYITDWNQFNFASYIIPVKTGDFVIFPSGLLHYTQTNTKDDPRISISGDILLTMKENIKTEHCIPHPSGWKTL